MINEENIINRAKFLYCNNCRKNDSEEDMRAYIRQAIGELTRPEDMSKLYITFDITLEDCVDEIINLMKKDRF